MIPKQTYTPNYTPPQPEQTQTQPHHTTGRKGLNPNHTTLEGGEGVPTMLGGGGWGRLHRYHIYMYNINCL